MSNISTDDCKDFLMTKFPKSKRALWKREKKYKNEAGNWCRDFSNTDVGNVSLVETNGVLSFFKKTASDSTAAPAVNAVKLGTHDIFVKTFDDKEIELAKKIVEQYMQTYNPPRSTEKGFLAIPSQFTYSFTDMDDDEEGLFAAANENLDINAKFKIFTLYLAPIEHPNFDQHLQSLLEQFFPKSSGEDMECVFSFYYDRPISIKDFVTMMSKNGFTYSGKSGNPDYYDDHCLLKNVMDTLKFHSGATVEEAFKNKVAESTVETPKTNVLDNSKKDKFVTTIDSFCDVVKNDDAAALNDAIENGLDLNLKVNRISVHSYCLNNNLKECFKVLVAHTPNLAVGHDGEANTVWLDAIQFKDDSEFDYITYLVEHGHYDFTKQSYLANAAFVYFLQSAGKLEEKFDTLNAMYAACSCYVNSISNADFYNNDFVKKQVRKAMFDYADFSNVDPNVSIALTNDVIIQEILDLMIEKGDVCIVGTPLRQYLTLVIDRFKYGFWGYDDIERKDNIIYYENALKKIGGI
jgi:hypothetical protein